MDEKLIAELITICLMIYRKKAHEEGPLDRLQTREFRAIIDGVQKKEPLALFWLDLLYHLPMQFQEGFSLLGELPNVPKRVLDIGSGLGPFSLAASYKGVHDVTRVDTDSMRLDVGAEISGKMGFSVRSEKEIPKREKPFDLILLNRNLLEKRSGTEDQTSYLESHLPLLSEQGHILLVEDSQEPTMTKFLKLRDHLVKKGIPIQAPCVYRGECPALLAKSPCYAQRPLIKPHLMKEIQRGLDINLSSLKMAYLLLRNPKAGWPSLPPHPLYRVISPPVEMMGSKRFYLCGTDGKKNVGSRLSEHPKESRAFEYLKRGELISFKGALQNKALLDIVEGTEVKVEAAVGKPLPESDLDGERKP